MDSEENFFLQFLKKVLFILDTPVEYVRENIIVPNQKKYPWYHQKFRRVPTIADCNEVDIVCRLEAQMQFERDKMVDDEILAILRQRYEDCGWYYGEDKDTYCTDLYKSYIDASGAWYTKYGGMAFPINVLNAFMKQKHRMIWERRHGPVGGGKTNKKYAA